MATKKEAAKKPNGFHYILSLSRSTTPETVHSVEMSRAVMKEFSNNVQDGLSDYYRDEDPPSYDTKIAELLTQAGLLDEEEATIELSVQVPVKGATRKLREEAAIALLKAAFPVGENIEFLDER